LKEKEEIRKKTRQLIPISRATCKSTNLPRSEKCYGCRHSKKCLPGAISHFEWNTQHKAERTAALQTAELNSQSKSRTVKRKHGKAYLKSNHHGNEPLKKKIKPEKPVSVKHHATPTTRNKAIRTATRNVHSAEDVDDLGDMEAPNTQKESAEKEGNKEDQKIMRIVVGEATGDVGMAVVKALSETRHEVVAVVRNLQDMRAKELESLPGVVLKTRHEAFDKPIDRAYLACYDYEDQLVGEMEFYDAAKKAGVQYVVKYSSFLPSIADKLHYAISDCSVELFLKDGDVNFTCVRANVFPCCLGMELGDILATKQFRSVLRNASVAIIDPSDVGTAAARLLVLEDPSPHYRKTYMMTGSEDVNNATIAADLKEVLNADITFAGNSNIEDLAAKYRALGYSEKNLEDMHCLSKILCSGRLDRADTRTSQEILALASPKSTFKDYIRNYYERN